MCTNGSFLVTLLFIECYPQYFTLVDYLILLVSTGYSDILNVADFVHNFDS